MVSKRRPEHYLHVVKVLQSFAYLDLEGNFLINGPLHSTVTAIVLACAMKFAYQPVVEDDKKIGNSQTARKYRPTCLRLEPNLYAASLDSLNQRTTQCHLIISLNCFINVMLEPSLPRLSLRGLPARVLVFPGIDLSSNSLHYRARGKRQKFHHGYLRPQ